MLPGAGEQQSDFLAQLPPFLAAQPSSSGSLRSQAGKDVCHRWLSAEIAQEEQNPAFNLQSIHSPGSHCACSSEWGSNRHATDSSAGNWTVEEDGGRDRAGEGGMGEEEQRGREGTEREEEPVKTPDSTPNPFAKPLSKLILINERFTWVEHCF